MRTSTEYLRLLQSLLPKGRFWNREEGSVLTNFLHSVAEELSRIDGRSDDLMVESDPRTTDELLTEWEKEYDLPDDCFVPGKSIQQRKNDIFARLITVGQQDKGYFIDLAKSLGFTVTITEFKPFWMNVGAMGDGIGELINIFYWQINYNVVNGGAFGRSFSTGFDTSENDLEAMQCYLTKLKPAHTQLLFKQIGPAFSKAFSSAYDSEDSGSDANLQGAFDKSFGQGYNVANGGAYDNSFGIGFNKSN